MVNIPTISSISRSEPQSLRLLISIWAVIQLVAYFVFGVLTPVDTELYLEGAARIGAGHWPTGHDFYYSSYMVLLAALQMLGLKLSWIVLVQIFASGISVYCLFKFTQQVSGRNHTAFVAGLLYVLWFKFQQWNLILYTDSLFASLTIIAFYMVNTAKGKLQYAFSILLIIFTTFIRPTGVCFLISIVAYLLFDFLSNKKNNSVKISTVFGFLLISLLVLNSVLQNFVDSFIQSYTVGELIYPKITLGVEPPGDLYIPDKNFAPLIRLFAFFGLNPIYSLKLILFKGALFLGHIKPYYSTVHNVFIGLFLFPVYGFAFSGSKLFPKSRTRLFIVLFIFIQVLCTSLTSENWDGRFILSVLPWIFIFSAFGISNMLTKFNAK